MFALNTLYTSKKSVYLHKFYRCLMSQKRKANRLRLTAGKQEGARTPGSIHRLCRVIATRYPLDRCTCNLR